MEGTHLFQKNNHKMKSYIGYSTDAQIRHRATSGGIGTSLVKWLFDQGIVETSISFSFNPETLEYTPKIIHSFEEYEICGSIYHEIDLIKFIKSHLQDIRGGFVCFALPCQTQAIRKIIERNGNQAIILGLTCSSQQTIEATKYLLYRNNIDVHSIKLIKYRGDGWPGGVKIDMKNGTNHFFPNNASLWTSIFHSRMFIRKKCFKCKDTLNKWSDLALADPWLNEYIKNEKIGQTVCTAFTKNGLIYLKRAQNDGYISIKDLAHEKVVDSQRGTIQRKESYLYSPKVVDMFYRITQNKIYRYYVLKLNMFSLHCSLKKRFESILMYKSSHKK